MPVLIGFPGKDAAGNQVANPFQEQLDFFRAKLNLPTERWDDIIKAAHDRAFVVAGAGRADLLGDLHDAIGRAIQEGRGMAAFRKEFEEIVRRRGWTGWTGEGTAAGQAWRTRVIYRTNMATSYAAGRWQQLTNPKLLALRPYWKYQHSDSVLHPRPLHVSWHGVVLPHDHIFWQTHFPPNGWGCQCWVVAVSAKEFAKAQAEGRASPPDGWQDINPKTGAPAGIDKGWDYAPGAAAHRPLQELVDRKLVRLASPAGAAFYDAMRATQQAERKAAYGDFLEQVLADPVKRGRTAIVGAIEPATLHWLRENVAVEPVSAEIALQDSLIIGKKAARHAAARDALTVDEWADLPDRLAQAEQILYDTRSGKLLYIFQADDGRLGKVAVEFDFRGKRDRDELNMIVSAFKVPSVALEADIKGGFLQVVR